LVLSQITTGLHGRTDSPRAICTLAADTWTIQVWPLPLQIIKKPSLNTTIVDTRDLNLCRFRGVVIHLQLASSSPTSKNRISIINNHESSSIQQCWRS
jgi:hypothetical protein